MWKNIPGWEHYQINKQGEIKSLDRTIKCFWKGKWVQRIYKGKTLKASKTVKGYKRVSLSKNSKVKFEYVHDLMMLTFHKKKPKGKMVLHWNDIKDDNRFLNLRYGTMKQNGADRKRNNKNYE